MRRGDCQARIDIAHRKRMKTAALLIFGCAPLTIALGIFAFNDRKFMIISALILLYTIAPFYMVFEHRKPKARETVLLAMVSALTVCIQLIFRVTIPIRAGSAMVILSGVSLGPEAGFLIGALSRFVLNFYEGQGPWTPWQMFCWGLLSFLAGLVLNQPGLEKKKSRSFQVVAGPLVCVVSAVAVAYALYRLFPGEDTTFLGWRLYVFGALGLIAGVLIQRKRLPVDDITLSMYTFFSIFIIYGGLMNICAMTSAAAIPGSEISWTQLKILYISGVGYDFRHALGAALFMFAFGNTMITKLERIKIKYGIYR